jgi:hypothetical protein
MATKKTVKAKAMAKASVRVNVNVNSKNRKVVRGRQFPVPYPTALPPVRVEVHTSAPQQPVIQHQPPMMRDTHHPVGINITNHGTPQHHPPKVQEVQAESEEPKTTGRFQGVKDYITNKADTFGDYAIGTGSAISAVGLPQVGGALATAGSALKAVPKANEIYESGKKMVSSAREMIVGKSEIQPDWNGMTRDEVRDTLKRMGKYQGKSGLNKDDLVKYAKSLG